MSDRLIEQFRARLRAWDFDEVRAMGVEANVANFRNGLRDIYDDSFPWVKDKKKRKDEVKPWLDNADFKVLVREKGKLYLNKIKGRLQEGDLERLAAVTKEVNRVRQRLKRAYFAEKLETARGDLRANWEVLGEVLHGRKKTKGGNPCKYFEKDGVGVTDGAKIAEGFCEFYCRVGPDLAARLGRQQEEAFLEYMGDRATDEFVWRPTSPMEVEEACRGLDTTKAAGWDGVSPRVVKAAAGELAGPLARLYNCCMREGYYPECFKIARVIPVFKGEDPTQFSNYRPVSVLPTLSQIFERILKRRLVQFLDQQGVIIPGQYGFRAGHSTAMAILDMVERVRGAWAEGSAALGVFIDLKKAFDTVDHRILLRKLDHYGIRGNTLRLLGSYLENRKQ